MERRKGDAADSVLERTNARNGFSNVLMYGQNTVKKRLVLYGRLNDVRRKCGGTNGREPGKIKSQKRTEGGGGKEREFTQQFLKRYFSSNRERNKERQRRKEGIEDGDARYGGQRGLDPLTPATKTVETKKTLLKSVLKLFKKGRASALPTN